MALPCEIAVAVGGFHRCEKCPLAFWQRDNFFRDIDAAIQQSKLHIQLCYYGSAPGAQALFVGFFGVHPAPGALGTLCLTDADGDLGEVDALSGLGTSLRLTPGAVGHDKQFGKVLTLTGGFCLLYTSDAADD